MSAESPTSAAAAALLSTPSHRVGRADDGNTPSSTSSTRRFEWTDEKATRLINFIIEHKGSNEQITKKLMAEAAKELDLSDGQVKGKVEELRRIFALHKTLTADIDLDIPKLSQDQWSDILKNTDPRLRPAYKRLKVSPPAYLTRLGEMFAKPPTTDKYTSLISSINKESSTPGGLAAAAAIGSIISTPSKQRTAADLVKKEDSSGDEGDMDDDSSSATSVAGAVVRGGDNALSISNIIKDDSAVNADIKALITRLNSLLALGLIVTTEYVRALNLTGKFSPTGIRMLLLLPDEKFILWVTNTKIE